MMSELNELTIFYPAIGEDPELELHMFVCTWRCSNFLISMGFETQFLLSIHQP